LAWNSWRRAFGRSSEPRTPDWARDPIPPSPWARHATPFPDSLAVVDEAVRISGLDPAQVDRPAAVRSVWRLVVGVGKNLLDADPAAAQALDVVWARADLSDDLLWNFFTHQGARGIAARNHLIASVFATGQAVDVVVEQLREGAFRLPGRDSRRP
jgi:hypothetical protein